MSTAHLAIDDDEFKEDISETLQGSITESEGYFTAQFNEGYHFRNLIEYLKRTNVNGNFIFTQDAIRYSSDGFREILLNMVEIQASELADYEYHGKTEMIVMGVNLVDMRNITKSISKKDGVRLSKKPNDNKLYLEIISNSAKGVTPHANLNIIQPQKIAYKNYDVSGLTAKFPNCIIAAVTFTKMCTSMAGLKPSYVIASGFPKGVKFEAITESSRILRVEQFGTVPENSGRKAQLTQDGGSQRIELVDNPEVPKIKVSTDIIQSLGKLNNISHQNTLKIFIENDDTLRICSPVSSSLGTLDIYIRNQELS